MTRYFGYEAGAGEVSRGRLSKRITDGMERVLDGVCERAFGASVCSENFEWHKDGKSIELPPVGTKCLLLAVNNYYDDGVTDHNKLCTIVAHVQVKGVMMAVYESGDYGVGIRCKDAFKPAASANLLELPTKAYCGDSGI